MAFDMALSVRDEVKKRPNAKRLALWGMRLLAPFRSANPVRAFSRYPRFLRDWVRFRKARGNASVLDFYPCLFDRTVKTGIDSHYFHQAVWALRQVLAARPDTHVDIGSDVRFVGMLSAVSRVTFLDIRPIEARVRDLHRVSGSILDLPFADSSVGSLSSLHVIEHVGLGRYGDPINPDGSILACRELARVLVPGGRLYVSLPLGTTRVQFNGQRVFAAPDVVRMFAPLRLQSMTMVDESGRVHEDIQVRDAVIGDASGTDCGLGMYVFRKSAED